MKKTRLERVIDFINKVFKEKYNKIGIQVFNVKNTDGDKSTLVYNEDGVTIDYCIEKDYIEILGLQDCEWLVIERKYLNGIRNFIFEENKGAVDDSIINNLDSKLSALADRVKSIEEEGEELLKEVLNAFYKKYGTRTITFNNDEGEVPADCRYTNRYSTKLGFLEMISFDDNNNLFGFTFVDFVDGVLRKDNEGLTYNAGEVAHYIFKQLKYGRYVKKD